MDAALVYLDEEKQLVNLTGYFNQATSYLFFIIYSAVVFGSKKVNNVVEPTLPLCYGIPHPW